MDVTLTVRSPEGTRRIPFTGDRLSIGRSGADLAIADQGLSRIHASLHRAGDRVWILDEGSANGTRVNGKPVTAKGASLEDRAKIELSDQTTITVNVSRSSPGHSKPLNNEEADSKPTLPRFAMIGVVALAVIFVVGSVALGGLLLKSRADSRKRAAIENASPTNNEGDSSDGQANSEPGSSDKNAGRQQATPIAESSIPAKPANDAVVTRRLYSQMSEQERLDFIDRQAQQISVMMGNRPYAFTEDVLRYIKKYVDGYASRSNSSATKLWGEGLPSLYGRASHYAPYINKSFNARGVPPVVGLYLAMIETEYHECLESPVGSKGIFQFMPDTARGYGVDPADRCDVKKIAPAAAHYMSDRIAEFGPDSMSVALAIAGYNRSPDSVRRDLRDVLNSENKERSFWTLIANSNKLDHFFQDENIKYVPKFFAAAIVGETPWAFGLKQNPLSTYTDTDAQSAQ